MACFVVPTVEAIVTTTVSHVLKTKAKKNESESFSEVNEQSLEILEKQPFYKKIDWLSKMLWGGSVLLAFEHVWHGEIEPWFPFLTAARNPEEAVQMLHEMSTVGVSMAGLVTTVWIGMVVVSKLMERRLHKLKPQRVLKS